ncbi:ATP-dependent Clp protease ATP-binding subunit [Candidatus Saccharibacteria bacterium TM7i]|nr:ATP-dependent Clp protease ATP-binding subunit [Candidatus Saccharibacteria bacterium TM7i]
MDKTLFNWHSRRARLARYGHALRAWVLVITILSAALIILGIFALVAGLAFGWLLIGFAALPAMVVQWYNYELSALPNEKSNSSIDAVMDTELLSLLSQNPSPKELAVRLNETNGGLFFEVRFGLGGGFFKEVATDNPADTAAIFNEALSIASQVGGRVSPGVIILAMVRQLPMKQTVLGHLQLSEDDLMTGIIWYHRLHELANKSKKQTKQPGGVGRDWSFGWIPTLQRFGVSLAHGGTASRNDVRTAQVGQLIGTLGSGGGTIGIIGRDGVGKTELVRELANTLMRPDKSVPRGLWYQQVFMLDASRILSAGNERGAVEQIVGAILGEAYAAKNIIVCFDNAELFFQDGVGSVDISNLLTPIVEAGRLRMIMTIDEQNFLRISKQAPALANSMTRVIVQPTDEKDTIRVLEDHIPFLEYKRKNTFMYQALKEAYRLSQRYVYDVSMPGQAIRLLEQSAEHAEGGKLVSARSVAQAIEHMTGVKTGAAAGDEEREMLLNLEARIHERMIGQERAVSVVADALRRARSGVRNQNRPVGTFLFLGPTGVGKTELAKSLAEVYFGGEQNIIRLDMNEFVSPDDVARLIADGADDAGSLAAQVMKQPFSVVLLDELEKAHSSVLTTLLQLLDEGVLRDVRGREVSFRDTVVIATSNAGASRIQEYIQRGYTLQQFEETFINELISGHIFHPEFLNRFDEMVVFSPLSKPELLQVVDLILKGVNKNLAEQQITISVTPDAKEYLVERGYDPRLGARPMRRVVQRAVESTVAKLLLSNAATPGSVIELTKEQVEAVLGPEQQAQAIISGQ